MMRTSVATNEDIRKEKGQKEDLSQLILGTSDRGIDLSSIDFSASGQFAS